MKNLNKDVKKVIMDNLSSADLGAVRQLSKEYRDDYSNLFFAKQCLERNNSLGMTIEIRRDGDKAYIHYNDETERETEALDATGLRHFYQL